jgi:hypothetical protein
MLYKTELSRKWAFIWYFSGFSAASWFCKYFDSLLIFSHFGGSSRNYHQFLSNVIPTQTWQNKNYSIIDDSSQRNPPHNYKLLLLASMHRYIRTAPSPPASKHECHPLGKHSSSMQTVEVFVKPGYSREPRKIPNESPFSAEFRGI